MLKFIIFFYVLKLVNFLTVTYLLWVFTVSIKKLILRTCYILMHVVAWGSKRDMCACRVLTFLDMLFVFPRRILCQILAPVPLLVTELWAKNISQKPTWGFFCYLCFVCSFKSRDSVSGSKRDMCVCRVLIYIFLAMSKI